MSHPRTIWVSPLVALFSTGFALAVAQDRGDDAGAARQPKQAVAAARAPMDMAQLLTLWEGQSKKLKTLEVRIYRVDIDPAWNDEVHYTGRAAFKNPQLAHLDFRKVTLKEQQDPKDKTKKVMVPVKQNGVIKDTPHETIICTTQEVWHYRSDRKQVFIYPLDKDARKRALDEGPLPFLFNMRADDAQRRYQMVLQGQDETKYLVMIKPKLKEDQDTFSTAWIYLDKKFLVPTRIYLLAPDKKSSKDFQLSQIQANKPVQDSLFVGVLPGKTWKVERNPVGDAAAPAGGVRAPRRPILEKAARRPADPNVDQPR